MNRRELVAVTVVVLVVGLGAAAASFDTAVFETGSPGEPGTTAEGSGFGPTAVLYLYVAIVLFAVFGLYFAIRSGDAEPHHLVGLAAGMAVAAIFVYGLLALGDARFPADLFENLTGIEPAPEERPPNVSAPSGPPGGGDSTGSGGTGPLVTLVMLGVFVGLAGVGIAAMNRVLRSAETTESASPSDPNAAIGRAAGRAADRLVDRTLANPVYRAWAEMTDGVGVAAPDSTTPAEFADAAIEAGLDPADVHALTDLFREVRYGDAPVTETRIERAEARLRRIEAQYADGPDGGEEP